MIAALFILAVGAGFAAGIFANASVPDIRARGVAVIAGLSNVRINRPNKHRQPSMQAYTGAKNTLSFLWHWRKAVLAVLILLFLWSIVRPVWSFLSCPFGGAMGWCSVSRAQALEERDELRGALEAERELARVVVPIIGTWERTRANIDRDLAIGVEQIENAALVPQGVPHETQIVSQRVLVAWARADQRLCDNAGGCGDTRA